MDNLLICRGNVYLVGTDNQEAFSVSPSIGGSSTSPIILQSINVDTKVINLPVVCLNDTRILYVFGKDFGDISVGGLAMLGKGGTGSALAQVVSYYKDNAAVDGGAKPVSVSLPGNVSYKFYLLGLVISDPNPELQYFPFMLTGKIIE